MKKPQRADLVLYINTEQKGKTLETLNALPTEVDFVPDLKADKSTKAFVQMVEDAVNAGYPVGVADIKYANGADNALMNILEQKNLLFRLKAYSGWNTATNSTGFALGTGMLAGKMTDAAKNHLLTVRYLDDWAYQANVRAHVGTELVRTFGSYEYFYKLDDKLDFAEKRYTELMRDFARKHLPEIPVDFSVKNPWLRMFECDLLFAE